MTISQELGEDIAASLQSIARSLEVMAAREPDIERYCTPLIEDGATICPGGIRLRPSFRDGERVEDKFFHPLPADKHGLVPFGDDGGSVMRRNHSPYLSKTTTQPPQTHQREAPANVSTATGEIHEPSPAPDYATEDREPEAVAKDAEWHRYHRDEIRPLIRQVLDVRFGMSERVRTAVARAVSNYGALQDEDQRLLDAKAEAVGGAMEAFWVVFREVPLIAICEAEDGSIEMDPERIEGGQLGIVKSILERYLGGEDVREDLGAVVAEIETEARATEGVVLEPLAPEPEYVEEEPSSAAATPKPKAKAAPRRTRAKASAK